MLNVPVRVQGEGSGRLVLAHGFTQSGEFWRAHAEALSDLGEVLAPDLPGHGQSLPQHDTADLWEAAQLVGEVGGRAHYVGYSLGARVLLHLALDQPDLVGSLVLVGAKGGISDLTERAYRHGGDEAASERLERQGLEEFIDEWLEQPFNARLSAEAQQRDLRLANRAAGLASNLRHCGSGTQEALWSRLSKIDIPVLIVHGEYDLPVILEDSRRLQQSIGDNARLVSVPGCGHSVPFEDPDSFLALVCEFVS